MAFQDLLRLLTDGVDKVDAGTLNNILIALHDNVNHLRDLLNAASEGTAIYARDVALKSDVLEGQAVYWNSTNGRFEKALAASDTDDDDNLILANSAQVWGIVSVKSTSIMGDVLLAGYAEIDLTNAVSGSPTAGVYYLSGTTAGTLTHTIPAVVVSVLQYDGNGYVCVRPSFRDALDTFASVDTVVTNLISLSDRLIITCQTTGDAATKGPLQIDLSLDFIADESEQAGHIVFKTLEDNEFKRGPVVESLIAGDNVTLESTDQDGTEHRGKVTVNADIEIGGKSLPIELVRLDNTSEEFYKEVTAIGFEEDKTSSIRGKVFIPNNTPSDYTLKFVARILGRSVGDLPELTMSYRRIPKNAGVLSDKLALPTSDIAITIDTTITLDTGEEDYYVEAESEDFDVEPGDVVLFTLERDSAATGPDIYLLDIRGELVA